MRAATLASAVFVRLLAVAASALVLAGSAAADGDPASDTLYQQNAYVPYPAPPPADVTALKQAIDRAYGRGYRVKVAVIATRTDLGAVPELFGKPDQYASFLGSELRGFYIGPLLIVMPAGFGIYDGGRSTAAEERVLSTMSARGSTASALTETAASAVTKLTGAGALRSKDILAPIVYAVGSTGRRGSTVAIRLQIVDDSSRSRVTVRIYAGPRQVGVVQTGLRPTDAFKLATVKWAAPKTAARRLRFCAVGTDAGGNKSRPSCAPLTLR
jgi:ribosomal protein S28E/S33